MKKIFSLFRSYLWAVPFIIFIVSYIGASLFIPKRAINAPDLIGKQTHEATQICSPLRIHLYITEEKIEDDLPTGTIIHQKPSPNATLKAGQPIFIVTSKQNDRPVIPDFMNQSKSAVTQWCKEKGVKYKIYAIPSNHPENSCIGQYPQASTQLVDKKIIIYVSQKKYELWVFPSLLESSADEVDAFVKKYGYEITYYEKNKPVEIQALNEYRVIQQKPAPGTFMKHDKKIHIQCEVEKIRHQNSFWHSENQ